MLISSHASPRPPPPPPPIKKQGDGGGGGGDVMGMDEAEITKQIS